MGMTNSDWKKAYNIVCDDRDAMRSAHGKAVDRIRELEAELQVRDNMGEEVLRLLREATGKRDFHSEMEAAGWAAKMLAEARLNSARLAEIYSRADVDPRGYIVFRPIQLPPKADWDGVTCKWNRDIFNAAIDAAMEVPQ